MMRALTLLCIAWLCSSVRAEPPPSAAAVRVPSTAHVHVDVPAGLQDYLDADSRLRPWLARAVATVDACYSELRSVDPSAAGSVSIALTMHKNARPSADIDSLPDPLKPLVLCVTARMMNVRMPLFTGDEGDSFKLRVRLSR
ncbi:MAG TPA: hypothetical protein VHZ95_18165 [Polyangiales bacterium]|nr:hypothetical protein [Polyangiales bacterium]